MFRRVKQELTHPLGSYLKEGYYLRGNNYGLSHPDEFLSELFSNPTFARVVGNMPSSIYEGIDFPPKAKVGQQSYTGIGFLDRLIDLLIHSLFRSKQTVESTVTPRSDLSIKDYWTDYIRQNEASFKQAVASFTKPQPSARYHLRVEHDLDVTPRMAEFIKQQQDRGQSPLKCQ